MQVEDLLACLLKMNVFKAAGCTDSFFVSLYKRKIIASH
jgi:hypothetical protein